jgi:hypothetical protein
MVGGEVALEIRVLHRIEQRLCFVEIGYVEAFGEPAERRHQPFQHRVAAGIAPLAQFR